MNEKQYAPLQNVSRVNPHKLNFPYPSSVGKSYQKLRDLLLGTLIDLSIEFLYTFRMLNPEERALKGLLQFWSMLFLAMGIVVVFFPNLVIQFLNQVSLRFTPTLPLLPYSEERLWVVLAFSLFITLTFICYSAQDDLKRRRDLVQFLLVSKLISALIFTLCLFFDRMSLAYLIAAIIDGGIFTLTSAYYSRVLKSSHLVL